MQLFLYVPRIGSLLTSRGRFLQCAWGTEAHRHRNRWNYWSLFGFGNVICSMPTIGPVDEAVGNAVLETVCESVRLSG